jgi:hypothetical protein
LLDAQQDPVLREREECPAGSQIHPCHTQDKICRKSLLNNSLIILIPPTHHHPEFSSATLVFVVPLADLSRAPGPVHTHNTGGEAKERKRPRGEFRTFTHANSYWNSCVLLN